MEEIHDEIEEVVEPVMEEVHEEIEEVVEPVTLGKMKELLKKRTYPKTKHIRFVCANN